MNRHTDITKDPNKSRFIAWIKSIDVTDQHYFSSQVIRLHSFLHSVQ